MSSKCKDMDSDSADEFNDACSDVKEEYANSVFENPFKKMSIGDDPRNPKDDIGSRYGLDSSEKPTASRPRHKREEHGGDEDGQDKFDDCTGDVDEEGLAKAESALSEDEKKANKVKASNAKAKANDYFKSANYQEALDLYTEALFLCPVEGCSNDRAILYANRAAAKMQLGSKNSAIEDCTIALKLNPTYFKALLRRAKLYEETEKLDESLEDYTTINKMDPSNQEAGHAIMRLPPLIAERNEKLKTQMLGQLKDLGNMILKPFGLSTSNFQMQQDPATGSYSVNFNQNAK